MSSRIRPVSRIKPNDQFAIAPHTEPHRHPAICGSFFDTKLSILPHELCDQEPVGPRRALVVGKLGRRWRQAKNKPCIQPRGHHDRAFPIRRAARSSAHVQIRAIAAENRMPSVPIRFVACCITNTPLRSSAHSRLFADNGCRCAGIVSAPPTHSGAEEQWLRSTPSRRSRSVRLLSAASSYGEGMALRDQSRLDC